MVCGSPTESGVIAAHPINALSLFSKGCKDLCDVRVYFLQP